jgi:nucleoside-diphosphate-sugar epimerase
MVHAVVSERLIVSDDEPAPYSEVLRHLAAELGVAEPVVDASPPSRQRGGDKRCDNRRLRDLGISLRYPSYREGYASLL